MAENRNARAQSRKFVTLDGESERGNSKDMGTGYDEGVSAAGTRAIGVPVAVEVESPAAKGTGEPFGQRLEDCGAEPGGMGHEEIGAAAPEVGEGDGQPVLGHTAESPRSVAVLAGSANLRVARERQMQKCHHWWSGTN